jgi:hypothetical protein
MKLIATILSAALIAAMPTLAFAQGGGPGGGGSAGASGGSSASGGGSVGAGSDPAGGPHGLGRGADANPTGPGTNPMLGNSAAPPTARGGGTADNVRWGGSDSSQGRMYSRPVRGRR